MKLYSQNENYKLYNGDMNDLNSIVENNSIDAIVTDPPYELGFMGKSWDASGIAFRPETWRHCWDVLKPGGYLLAFGGSRTFHRIACAIEDAGFEIRDTIIWLYGSGFPKSMNIGLAIDKKSGVESKIIGIKEHCKKDFKENNLYAKADANKNNTKCFGYGTEIIKSAQNEWSGWGTALKPAYEPIIVARKPCDGSCVDNVLKYGVGGINIDECRVATDDVLVHGGNLVKNSGDERQGKALGMFQDGTENTFEQNPLGRFPANTILTYDDSDFDEVCGGFPDTASAKSQISNKGSIGGNGIYAGTDNNDIRDIGYNDSGSASRYFYCAKASKRDRDEGLDAFEDRERFQQGNYSQSPTCSVCGKTFNGTNDHSLCGEHTMIYVSKDENRVRKNTHPTVKPTALMQYLVRLVAPKGATILDPFMGSGSTGKATMYENMDRDANYKFVGIELTDEYLPIAKARIDYVVNHGIVLDRGEDETTNEVSGEPKPKFERFTWDLE